MTHVLFNVTSLAPPQLSSSDFPMPDTVGVYAAAPGWEPETTIDESAGDGFVQYTTEDEVIEDTRFVNTAVIVKATHVTFRRCEIISNVLQNHDGGPTLYNGMVLEDCTFRNDPDGVTTGGIGNAAVSLGGMTLTRCSFDRVTEGVRVGGTNWTLADPADPNGYQVRIHDCYIGITGPNPCDEFDYHGDCMQSSNPGVGVDGVPVEIRNVHFNSLDRYKIAPGEDPPGCGGNSCMTGAVGEYEPLDVDRALMYGSGIQFYNRSGGIFRNLYFVQDSWQVGPLLVENEAQWDSITTWEDIYTCTIDSNGQPATLVHSIPRGWNGSDPLPPP